jgi:uncharacterized membrane-anchored protein
MSHPRFLLAIALAVAAVQIGVLSSMILGRASVLRDGQEVTLEVRPVDPRDLLRGDYVVLGYDISILAAPLFEGQGTADPSERSVYVRLRQGDDGIAVPVAARFGAPPQGEPRPGEIDIRGLTHVSPDAISGSVPVEYGIERFYLPEGEGRPIEEGMRERPFRMKVAVAGDGTAQIKAFYDGETLIYAEPIY